MRVQASAQMDVRGVSAEWLWDLLRGTTVGPASRVLELKPYFLDTELEGEHAREGERRDLEELPNGVRLVLTRWAESTTDLAVAAEECVRNRVERDLADFRQSLELARA
jgi:hypothetical protein